MNHEDIKRGAAGFLEELYTNMDLLEQIAFHEGNRNREVVACHSFLNKAFHGGRQNQTSLSFISCRTESSYSLFINTTVICRRSLRSFCSDVTHHKTGVHS